MNYYYFDVTDYSKCTSHLTKTEDLIYRRMLDLYYINEVPLSIDPTRVAKRIGMLENMDEVNYILAEYFAKTEEGFVNRRCEKEIEKYHQKVVRAKRAIKSRWNPFDIKKRLDLKRNTDNSSIKRNSNKIEENLNFKLKLKELKESTKEKTSLSLLIECNVDHQIAKDWIKLRTIQKAPVTGTVVRGFVLEANKANLTLNQVLTICIEKSWRGFKAEWLKNAPHGTQGSNAPDTTLDNTIAQWRKTEAGIMAKGKELKTPRGTNEKIKPYRTRLDEILKEK